MLNGSYLCVKRARLYKIHAYITYYTICDAKEIDVLSKWTKRVRQQQTIGFINVE